MTDLRHKELIKAIGEAIKEDDFNEAIRTLQDAIGQTSGDDAGIFFSDFEEDENGNILAWNEKENRFKLVIEYLLFEDRADDFFSEDY